MKEKLQPLVINVDSAKQVSKTSLISSVHGLWCHVGTTYCYNMIQKRKQFTENTQGKMWILRYNPEMKTNSLKK